MRLPAYAAALGLALLSQVTQGYEEETHRTITGVAVARSALNLSPVTLQNMGLDLSSQFPNSTGALKTIPDLLGDGAVFEDSFLDQFLTARSLRHFYNPINGQGLNVPNSILGLQVASPDWALARPGDVPQQDRSYWNAKKSFLDALTNPSKNVRDAAFGETFQFLGQVVHHLQDMAQPQHVRNDVHCPYWWCPSNVKFPSAYESWTNQKTVRDSLPTDFSVFGGYDITSSSFTSTFNSPRNFWNTTNPPGLGIAEFTNRNFVSARTNFDRPGLFPSPVKNESAKADIDIQVLCADPKFGCSNTTLTGPITFYATSVTDGVVGTTEPNPFASSLSIFDADLQLNGTPLGSQRLFALNRFNFTVAHTFLIPRAVAYSAGMINYFFRGKIDLVPDAANPGTFLIRNLGSEPMNGDFALYYDYDDSGAGTVNNRKLAADLFNGPIAANGQQNIGTLPDPATLNPAPKIPGEYMLVFQGDMGAETTAQGQFVIGAVVGKVVLIRKWTIVDLGVVGAFSQTGASGAWGISGNGEVTGNLVGGTTQHAFSWSSASGMQDLTIDPNVPPIVGFGINNSGQVVGLASNGGLGGFLWSSQSGLQLLAFDSSRVALFASAINDSGQIVGSYCCAPIGFGGLIQRAFISLNGLGIVDLGGFFDQSGSAAFGVNSIGQVVGAATTSAPTLTHAFLWSGAMQDLGALPGYNSSVARSVNDSGQVVGYSFHDNNDNIFNITDNVNEAEGRATLWSGSSGMQDLGTLPGMTQSQAYGINNKGQVVGYSFNFVEDSRAFLWSSGSGMQNLSEVPEVVAAGWSVLYVARAINDSGQIVGWGLHNGLVRAFLLTPKFQAGPPPSGGG
jgi:probable HAF family extracellular repeat protein